MWRESAIRSALLEEICGLPGIPQEASKAADDRADSVVDTQLRKARQRAGAVVVISWAALLILFLLRSSSQPWLASGQGEESIFTLGVLVVAVYSGFRLGQLEKLRAVARLLDELRERAGRS